MEALEDIDYNAIKDVLCQPNTEWNISGKNPGTINRPNLLPEVKLWNTIVKRNLMPTSHNQMVNRKSPKLLRHQPLPPELKKNREPHNQPHHLLNPKEAPMPPQQLKAALPPHQLLQQQQQSPNHHLPTQQKLPRSTSCNCAIKSSGLKPSSSNLLQSLRKRKTPAARIIQEDHSLEEQPPYPVVAHPNEQSFPLPAKR
ncbi:hypothetical protein V6N13_110626 [Hibiscus sabdariffa]